MSFTDNKKNTDMLYTELKHPSSHALRGEVSFIYSSVKTFDDINKKTIDKILLDNIASAPIGEVPEGQRGIILYFSLQDRAMEGVNILSRQEHIIPCPLWGNDLRAEDESDSDIRLSRAGQDRAREGVIIW